MKKLFILIVLTILLTGCSNEPTLEEKMDNFIGECNAKGGVVSIEGNWLSQYAICNHPKIEEKL